MGPQPCGHGYDEQELHGRRGREEVSMGPQPCGHGYLRMSLITHLAGIRFNGATTLRSWIPQAPVRESSERPAVSMGPQPCGHGYESELWAIKVRTSIVSMGPQPCGHGYSILVQVFVHTLVANCAFRNSLSRFSRLAPNFHLHLPYLGSKSCERSIGDRTRGTLPA